jgi:acetolactate synthase I/II/III large subunit
MIGADALLKTLENLGVREIFAYPGGAVLPIYDRMPEHNIRRILVRHEQAAAFAAQGYSRATKEVGVCLATSGPGATNLVTGIADARLDSVPMVAITGNVFAHLIGSDAFQEVDMIGICEPIVKHAYFVESADELPRVIQEAFYLAKSGRPGPVLIDIPKNVQADTVSQSIEKKVKAQEKFGHQLPGYDEKTLSDSSDLDIATQIISQAKKPVVIFGHGVILSEASPMLQNFLEKTQIPATWTLHGVGAIDTQSPLSLGMLGMHGTATANYAIDRADVIIGIGIRFDDRITGRLKEFQSKNKIIHLDIDPSEFNKNVDIDARILGQIRETLPKLTDRVSPPKSDAWNTELLEKKKNWKLDLSDPKKLTEISVLDELFAIKDPQAVVSVDVGQHEMWAAQRFSARFPRKFLASGGLGSMGFSLPAAMGAAFAGHETWSISGDGGFQMNLQELATIVQDKIPLKIVILNNSFLGMVRQWQELFYEKNYVDTPLVNPDFKALGEAYGIPSFRASTNEEAREILKKMKAHSGPILCEFVVAREENVFPMVPAGASLGETMLDRDTQI